MSARLPSLLSRKPPAAAPPTLRAKDVIALFNDIEPAYRARVTAEECAGVLAELITLAAIDPALAVTELRPLRDSLVERLRTCDGCGIQYLQKQRHRRTRNFHSDECRVTHSRQSA